MTKNTLQTNCLSGSKEWYEYKDGLVKLFPTFIYEVSLHKYWKNGYSLLGSKYYKTNKLLSLKHDHISTKFKDCILDKKIELIGVPIEFINEFQLKVYVPKPIIKKRKKK